jgi:putative addiction module component (TIGR02574 family)
MTVEKLMSPELERLSPSEREDLWNSLAATPEVIPLHDWQKVELDQRKANLDANPGSALTWDEIVRRVRSRLA